MEGSAAPRLVAYLYPWDLARGGVDAVLDDLIECGITGLNLTANYHAISSLSPRGDRTRLFFLPRGAVFFPARPVRYGRVKPAVWPDEETTSAWSYGAGRAIERGFTVSAWTIGMFQPWMAQDYPETARVFVTGDRTDTGVCPNSPDVQEYYANLVADLADQVPVQRFILEGLGIPDWDYGWVRPRVLADVSKVGKEVLRLCFCRSCQRLATGRGLDVVAIRKTALDLLERFGFNETSSDGLQAAEIFAANEELHAYSLLGTEGADSVARAMSRSLREGGLSAGVMVPAAPRPDGSEADLDRLLDVVCGINVWTAVMPTDVQRSYLPAVRAMAPDLQLSLVVGPPLAKGSAVTLVTPSFDYSDPAYLERIATAKALKPDEIAVYHCGLLDRSTFRMTVDTIVRS